MRHTVGKQQGLFEHQHLKKETDTTPDSAAISPVDQWSRAEFLIRLTGVRVAAAEVAGQRERHYGGFFSELAFLIEYVGLLKHYG